MKRLVLLIISVFIGIVAYADGVEYFEHVKSLYRQGRYEEAKQGFVSCKTYYSDELNVSSINEWIRLCQSKINERKAAIKARRQAEIAETKRRAEEARLAAERRAEEARLAEERRAYEARQQERKEKKLLYVSSNAFIFDKEYTGMHQAIKGYIAENSEQRFTDDPEMAYWCVYITANAYEYNYVKEEQTCYSVVYACVLVRNEITNEIIYENEIQGTHRGFPVIGENINKINIAYQRAAIKAYKEITQEIGKLVVKITDK